MEEKFSQSQQEKKREKDFNKAERIKETLMKLEKSVISEVDEATQRARGAVQAMGFGISPVNPTNEEEDEE